MIKDSYANYDLSHGAYSRTLAHATAHINRPFSRPSHGAYSRALAHAAAHIDRPFSRPSLGRRRRRRFAVPPADWLLNRRALTAEDQSRRAGGDSLSCPPRARQFLSLIGCGAAAAAARWRRPTTNHIVAFTSRTPRSVSAPPPPPDGRR